MTRSAAFGFLVSTSIALAACGGGGGSGSTGTVSPPPTQGTITGTAVKGPVAGATVTAYGISSGSMGSRIATARTDGQGNFSLSMGAYAGPVMLQMTGGTYTDEASGSSVPMLSGDAMTAVLPTMAAGLGGARPRHDAPRGDFRARARRLDRMQAT